MCSLLPGTVTAVELLLAPARINTVNWLPAHSLLSLYVKDIALLRRRPGHCFASSLLYIVRSRIVTSTLRASSIFVLLISERLRHAVAAFASSRSSAANNEAAWSAAPSMTTTTRDGLSVDLGFISHLPRDVCWSLPPCCRARSGPYARRSEIGPNDQGICAAGTREIGRSTASRIGRLAAAATNASAMSAYQIAVYEPSRSNARPPAHAPKKPPIWCDSSVKPNSV